MRRIMVSCFLWMHLFSFSQTINEENTTDEDLILESLFDENADKDVDDLLAELFKEQKDLDDLMATFSDFKFLYFSANYNSDTYFAGRDIGWNDYNVRPQISYFDASGFSASIGGAYYDGGYFDPKWDFTSLGAGYGKSFGNNNQFRASVGYTRFFYSLRGSNPYTNSLVLGIALRNKKRTLGTSLSFNESFGDNGNFQSGNSIFGEDAIFQLSYSVFGVVNILDKEKFRLQLRPRMNVLAGQQTIFEDTGEVEFFIEDRILYSSSVLAEKDIFDLMNVQINLPVMLTTEKWDVEVGYNVNLPYEVGGEADVSNTNFINISVGYLLEL